MSIDKFIQENGLIIDSAYLDRGVEAFVREMQAGLAGEESSLKMIPAYVSPDKLSEKRRPVIVIDAGGTNLRIALVAFEANGAPRVDYFEKYAMPGTNGELDKDNFYDAFARNLAPVAEKSDGIGFCFSFPSDITPELDGKIIHFSKEVKARDAEGSMLGECLRAALARRDLPHNHKVVVINDTVASLLGGMACSGGRDFDGYIGFILGTGTNCAYIEKNAAILKSSELKAKTGTSLVNMESGGYAKTVRNEIDLRFDASTETPGTQQLEKMISGAYQGAMVLEYIRAAAGCFSAGFGERLAALNKLTSKEIDDFCYLPYGDGALARLCSDDADRTALYKLIDAFFERAAALSVINLTAIMEHTGAGRNPLRPVCISAEGTTFYRCKLLHEKIIYLMSAYTQRQRGIYSEFIKAENATISGTAIAALLG